MKQYKQIYYRIMALSLCGISFTQAMDQSNNIILDYLANENTIALQRALQNNEYNAYDALMNTRMNYGALEEVLVEDVLQKGTINDIDPVTGQTLLINSVLNRNYDVIDGLVKKGADIRQSNAEGMTVLHAAIVTKDYHILRYLLDLDAKDLIKVRDNNGQDIFDIMKNDQYTSIMRVEMRQLLEEYGIENINDNFYESDSERSYESTRSTADQDIEQDNQLSDQVKESKGWSLRSLFFDKRLFAAGAITFVAGLAAYMKYKTPAKIEQQEQAE